MLIKCEFRIQKSNHDDYVPLVNNLSLIFVEKHKKRLFMPTLSIVKNAYHYYSALYSTIFFREILLDFGMIEIRKS